MMMERDEKWEQVLRRHWDDVNEKMDCERLNQKDYWYPFIDAAIEEGDFQKAMNFVREIPDVVTAAFAMDRIREGQKAKG